MRAVGFIAKMRLPSIVTFLPLPVALLLLQFVLRICNLVNFSNIYFRDVHIVSGTLESPTLYPLPEQNVPGAVIFDSTFQPLSSYK